MSTPPKSPAPSRADAGVTLTDAEAQAQGHPAAPATDSHAALTAPNAAPALVVRGEERYEIGELHGEGGRGQVLLAYDKELCRTVALKRLRYPDPAAEARFVREARITARLEHPGIVPVHDAGRHPGGQPFYAMKLVAGRPLRDELADAGTLEARLRLLPNLLAVAEAVAYAHRQGVIHRDIKPSNVVVGEFGETVVIDWGLAKDLKESDSTEEPLVPGGAAASGELTRAGDVLGTPAYMAPEQARGEAVDARADVYALGAVLYHVLAGEPAYGAGESRDILERLIDGPPLPIDQRVPKAAPELVAIVQKALAREPSDRYPDAAGFRDDLRRFQTGRLVQAHRYTLRQRVSRIARRQRALLSALALTVVAAGGAYAIAASDARTPSCDLPPGAFLSRWPARNASITAALKNEPLALDGWAAMSVSIDDYANALRGARVENCKATHERGEQSRELLDHRAACLRLREVQVDSLVDIVESQPGLATVNAVGRALASLPSVTACADTTRLLQRIPLPSNAEARQAIRQLEEQLASLRARLDAGRLADVDENSAQLLTEAERLAYPPVHAAALFARASAVLRLGRSRDALPYLRDAVLAAERGRTDDQRVAAELQLARVLGVHLDKTEPALRALARAEAIVSRAPSESESLEALSVRADIRARSREWKSALELSRRVVELSATQNGPDSPATAKLRNRLGYVLIEVRNIDEAVVELRRALAAAEAGLGPHHPVVGNCANYLGSALAQAGELDEAAELQQRAIAIYEADTSALPRGLVASGHVNLAITLRRQGRPEDALQHLETGLELFKQLSGPDSPRVADLLDNRGGLLSDLERHDEAIATAQRSVAIRVAASGESDPITADSLRLLGLRYRAANRPREALDSFRRALDLHTTHDAAERAPRLLAKVFLDYASLLIDESEWGTAQGVLKRVRSFVEDRGHELLPHHRYWLMFYLARAHARGKAPGSLARTHAQRALELARQAEATDTSKEIETWLVYGDPGPPD